MNTKQKGDIAEAHVMALLLKQGKTVLVPFGDRSRYDLALDEGGKLVRIQVKSGRIREGSVEFNTCSVSTENGDVVHRSYRGQVDVFAVYCHDNNSIYMIPAEVCGTSATKLTLKKKRQLNQWGTPKSANDFLMAT